MATPERRIAKGPKRGTTVYPPPECYAALGGRRTVTLTQAIACWAKMLEIATGELKFEPVEWRYLLVAVEARERDFDTDWQHPGERISELVEQALAYGRSLDVLGDHPQEKGAVLARSLKNLDYLHAWAVIWACQYASELPVAPKKNEKWWTLAHRQATQSQEVG